MKGKKRNIKNVFQMLKEWGGEKEKEGNLFFIYKLMIILSNTIFILLQIFFFFGSIFSMQHDHVYVVFVLMNYQLRVMEIVVGT